ncbi:MAG: hypothetical protein AAF591_04175 [Verrucomicrobiota bacterium]
MKRVVVYLFGMVMGSSLMSGCVVERTVTDSQGNVIIQEPTLANPFESKEEEIRQVRERERELGW